MKKLLTSIIVTTVLATSPIVLAEDNTVRSRVWKAIETAKSGLTIRNHAADMERKQMINDLKPTTFTPIPDVVTPIYRFGRPVEKPNPYVSSKRDRFKKLWSYHYYMRRAR